jgi:hypothetical protein
MYIYILICFYLLFVVWYYRKEHVRTEAILRKFVLLISVCRLTRKEERAMVDMIDRNASL